MSVRVETGDDHVSVKLTLRAPEGTYELSGISPDEADAIAAALRSVAADARHNQRVIAKRAKSPRGA